MDTIEEAVRVVTSKPVQRAVVNTALFGSGAATLLFLASVATGLFFQNFVPHQFVTTPVHLQYGLGPNPYGVASLTKPPMIKTQQEYEISVSMSMPRSVANLERGNFMVSLYLLGTEANQKLEEDARVFANSREKLTSHNVMLTSRRLALLPYVDPFISTARKLLFLLYHLFFPSSQSCKMTVALAERVTFPASSTLPLSAYVEVEAGQDIQIYSASLTMAARLRGLRWLMFHYRLPVYMAFTLLFWVCEVLFMTFAWAAWGGLTGSIETGKQRLYREEGDEDGSGAGESSDRPYTFPTYGKQPPLKHEPKVKGEGDDGLERRLSDIPLAGAEADDEEELDEKDDVGERRAYDSGLGTSYSEGGSGSVRRRSRGNP
ncbi:tubulin-tyrosine ligase [Drechmeria coniospora]|uniref:Tubulin-tyrosine ligase n=1 Tax=Drechmeria coniospora TaxID=98403 RepID=A0A151GDM8_DRECN|nr:tubulin-tyrosine ligase [Drechmeria coniospora]KYK55153.1 tubulin-tyrosine ligase [Drechmeria coniospora]ODA82220.1 hypothetical protein RJ55_00727 [Drechmeria coniospora]